MSDEAQAALVRQLRWQCRRGMKELDLVLVRFLDTRFTSASDSERHNFVRLLAMEDDQLWALLLGRSQSQEPEIDALVQRLRHPDRH